MKEATLIRIEKFSLINEKDKKRKKGTEREKEIKRVTLNLRDIPNKINSCVTQKEFGIRITELKYLLCVRFYETGAIFLKSQYLMHNKISFFTPPLTFQFCISIV